MITSSEESWATNTLRDAQDPGAGKQSWAGLTRITLEQYNLVFNQAHSRGYSSTGDPRHDTGTVLEDSLATLFKVALVSGDLRLTKWSVAGGLQYNDVVIVANANISDTAAPSLELVAGTQATVRVFYVDEDNNYIHYVQSADGGATFGAEQDVGGLSNLQAIASVSTTKVHAVSYPSGNSRFHAFEYVSGSWSQTDSLIYWPHEIEYMDAITIGDRDLIVFYSEGPMYGNYREAGIYGIWYEHNRWSDLFKIDVLDEATTYSYRQRPMISTANSLYFLTGYLSEGDADYNFQSRFLKTSKDGQYWSQYVLLPACSEAGPAKLLVVNAAAGQSWPWTTGRQVYVVGYDKVYESDATRLVGEINPVLQVDVTSRTTEWDLSRGIIAQATTILSNHDGALDNHAIINENNTLLLKREAGYVTSAGNEYAQLTLEQVDFIRETDRLPQRHKQVSSRDFMAWMRDKQADHHEGWTSQLVGYDNYHDDTETGYGGLSHTATQRGWWQTAHNVLSLQSNNQEGIAFTTWDSRIMNGQAKAMIRVETAGNNEYAGVIFRARDVGNFWAAYYNQATDRILLRRKTGGAWETAVAQSSALGWSVDTWYGIMVDFRYSYFQVFYSTDGLTWTSAFTYTQPANPLNNPLEYGYTGLVGYGYSSEDEDEEPGYEPPTPPPPVIPPGPGDGGLVYFVDADNGHVYRTRNARATDPTAVVYEDLGVVDSGGLLHIALDSWDPLNTAMVCGFNGVWKTTNLNDTTPTWTQVFSTPDANDEPRHIVSSICQQGLWMFVRQRQPTTKGMWAYWTTDGGTTWSYTLLSANFPDHNGAKIEASSHNANRAWIASLSGGGSQLRIFKTTDQWATFTTTDFPIPTWGYGHCHHPYISNPDDLTALYVKTATSYLCTNDSGSCTIGTLPAGGDANWCGSHTWGLHKYWVLTHSYYFSVSDDGINWTSRGVPGGVGSVVNYISGWPYDGGRFYATKSGTVAPLLISSDGGITWQAQTGNWASFGVNGNIWCCVPVWLV